MAYGTATVTVALVFLLNIFKSKKRAQTKVYQPNALHVFGNGTTDTSKGRWFYTCQNGEGRKCGMFLWDDDARPREAAALLNNSRTEPTSTPAKPLSPAHPSPQKMQSSPNSTSTLSNPSSTLKRPFSEAGLDDKTDADHDSFPWSLSGQEEAEVLDAPETPRKAVKFDGLTTPATSAHRKLPWLDHSAQSSSTLSAKASLPKHSGSPRLFTPSTSKLVVAQQGALTPQVTPSPLRFRDPVTLPANLTSKLREVLTRHELRIQGVVKGREITRLALKAREAKVVELQATIASLEAERNVDHARIETLEWEKDMLARDQNLDTEL
ncbi:hypothetical protein E4T50_01442 [Aureobasidium sp. EXF-12298]|nr:hypothetical protein E4T50_01442 [Aureobasidium sp. EXF-12298]